MTTSIALLLSYLQDIDSRKPYGSDTLTISNFKEFRNTWSVLGIQEAEVRGYSFYLTSNVPYMNYSRQVFVGLTVLLMSVLLLAGCASDPAATDSGEKCI
jgi:hypothetical protein